MSDLRYPIGRYEPVEFSEAQKEQWLSDIHYLPQAIENALVNLDEHQLHTPYRAGGWTVHQLVHHVADSHMNAYIRFKLGLTEDNPQIKPYDEKAWAETPDTGLPVNIPVTLLHTLHRKWCALMEDFSRGVWERTVFHPEYKKQMSLWYLLGMYAWHGRHHTAHIHSLRRRFGW